MWVARLIVLICFIARFSMVFGRYICEKRFVRTNFFSATEPPFTPKNTMFRANPNIKIASMIHENEAFVRGFLQIPTNQLTTRGPHIVYMSVSGYINVHEWISKKNSAFLEIKDSKCFIVHMPKISRDIWLFVVPYYPLT